MTREELIRIIGQYTAINYGPFGRNEYVAKGECADRILAALEKERAEKICPYSDNGKCYAPRAEDKGLNSKQ